jgi:methanogenic corrinoid protein MtbC1
VSLPPASSPQFGRKPDQRSDDAGAASAWLSIGAVSRATGIPVETLRTWEARYHFPEPVRKPSGHRVYPASVVPRLRLIAEAIAGGHRACEAVPAGDAALRGLLEATRVARRSATAAAVEPVWQDDAAWVAAVRAFDADRLTRLLLGEAARLGPFGFVEQRVAPMVSQAGELWSRGELEVAHEHFLSERVADVLRTLRLPYESGAGGPLVVFATLPGEQHALGLQMAALVVAATNCRVIYLGPEVPVEQLATLAGGISARALAVSVSVAADAAQAAALLEDLRGRLPRHVRLLVGGDGAPERVAGVDILRSLPALRDWARALAAF